jgi:hypothetical protein
MRTRPRVGFVGQGPVEKKARDEQLDRNQSDFLFGKTYGRRSR